jgi:hypothetical protein
VAFAAVPDGAVGTPGGIDDDRISLESGRLYAAVPSIAINLAVILAGIGAFALFRNQRKHREYLWLGFYLLLLGCRTCCWPAR